MLQLLHNHLLRNNVLRRRAVSLALAIITIFSWVFPAFAQEIKLYEEVDSFPVTRGAHYEFIRRFTSMGFQQIHVLKVDLNSDNINIDTLTPPRGYAVRDSLSKMVQENGAVAGINGDFFVMATPSAPVGIQIKDGRVTSSPANRKDMFSFGLSGDGIPAIFNAGYEGKVLSNRGISFDIGGINKLGDSFGKIFIYTRDFGESTPTSGAPDLTFAIVINNRIVEILDGASCPIPENGMVLVARSAAAEFINKYLNVGDPLQLELQITPDIGDLKMALGGGAILVEKGKIPASFSHNITGANPRTAVGFSQDNKTLFLVAVDGRQGLSRGMSQEELAALMLELGAYNALNLDGGGSTTMAVRPTGKESAEVVNSIAGDTQRLIANGIGIFSKSSPGNVKGLKINAKSFNVPLSGHRAFEVSAYDENFNPVPIDPTKVKWSVDNGLGDFTGNTFAAAKSGVGIVTASFGDIKATQDIRVLQETLYISMEPQKLQLKPGGKAPLRITATDKAGFSAPVDSADLAWAISEEIGAVVEDEFVAGYEGAGVALVNFSGKETGAIVDVAANGAGTPIDTSLLPKPLPLYDEANRPDKNGGLNFGALGFALVKGAQESLEKTQNIALEIIKQAKPKFTAAAGQKNSLDIAGITTSGAGYAANYEGDTLFLFMDASKGGLRATDHNQWINLQWDLSESKGKAKTVFIVMDKTPEAFTDKLEGDLLKKLFSGFAQENNQDIWVLGGGASRFDSKMSEGVHYVALPGAVSPEPSVVLFNAGGGKVSYRVVPLIESFMAEVTGAVKGRESGLKIYGVAPGGKKVPLAYPYAADWKLSTDKMGSFDPKTMTFKAKEAGSLMLTVSAAGISSAFDVNIADLSIVVKGKGVVFPDQQPYIDESQRTMVPVRFVSQSLGAQVGWDDPSKTVTIVRNGLEIKLKVGESKALVNGEAIAFDTKAVFKNDRTMVPLRFISEILGAKIRWEDTTRTVFIEE